MSKRGPLQFRLPTLLAALVFLGLTGALVSTLFQAHFMEQQRNAAVMENESLREQLELNKYAVTDPYVSAMNDLHGPPPYRYHLGKARRDFELVCYEWVGPDVEISPFKEEPPESASRSVLLRLPANEELELTIQILSFPGQVTDQNAQQFGGAIQATVQNVVDRERITHGPTMLVSQPGSAATTSVVIPIQPEDNSVLLRLDGDTHIAIRLEPR